jgi:feruloyl-CoA synthase
MQTDDQLRKTLLSRVQMFFYAGAALAQPIWDSLYASQEREVGERIVMGTGLGMTESGPFGIFVTNPFVQAGDLGVPTPGLELKLVDMQGKAPMSMIAHILLIFMITTIAYHAEVLVTACSAARRT